MEAPEGAQPTITAGPPLLTVPAFPVTSVEHQIKFIITPADIASLLATTATRRVIQQYKPVFVADARRKMTDMSGKFAALIQEGFSTACYAEVYLIYVSRKENLTTLLTTADTDFNAFATALNATTARQFIETDPLFSTGKRTYTHPMWIPSTSLNSQAAIIHPIESHRRRVFKDGDQLVATLFLAPLTNPRYASMHRRITTTGVGTSAEIVCNLSYTYRS